MIKRSFINTLPLQLKSIILDEKNNHDAATANNTNTSATQSNSTDVSNGEIHSFDASILNTTSNIDIKAKHFLIDKLLEQRGIIFTEFNDIQLKLFDVDSTLSPNEFDKLVSKLDNNSRILLCEKIKLIYGFNSLTSFIIRLINILNFNTFFSIFDITSNIKLYGFYSLNYSNPVEILVKQIRNDLFIVKSFKEFTIQEMKKEHDFHLPYKEFKRLNLNNGNLVVVKILFKNEQKPIDLALIKPLLPKIEMLHLSLENESKLKPFNDSIDNHGTILKYLKFGVNRGTFKKIPNKNNINVMKLVNIDNLNFINDLKDVSSLDVFFDNWELRKNCDIKFQSNFIINFEINQKIQNLKVLNIFHTYIDSKDLNKLKYFPNLTHSKISYVILDDNGFDLSECKNLQELKIHFTYQKSIDDINDTDIDNAGSSSTDVNNAKYSDKIKWPVNLKKLSITIHNIKNLIQNFSIRLNILKKISKPLPPSIIDLCIDISYDTGGSGPELYSISRDDILKISSLINKILTNNLENLKLKGISRYNYKIGKPLIFSAINFPTSLKLLSLNDFILDYNFINLPNVKKLYFEHSLFDSDFKLPNSDEILIEKCTFKDLSYIPLSTNKIEFKMCTFRKVPTYNGDISNIIINNCRVMEQPTNNIFQFQQQLQRNNNNGNLNQRRSGLSQNKDQKQQQCQQQQSQQQLSHQLQSQHKHNDQFNLESNHNSSQQINNFNSYGFLNEISNSNSSSNNHGFGNFTNSSSSAASSYPLHKSHSIFEYPTSSTTLQPHSNLTRSTNEVVNLLNKDLEFQLSNLSLNPASPSPYPNNTNNLAVSSPPPINMSISSPPISSSDSIHGSFQKRSDSFHNGNTNPESHFSIMNQFNRNSFSSYDAVDNELRSSLHNLYDNNQSSSPLLTGNSLISSPSSQHFVYHHQQQQQQQQPLSNNITGFSMHQQSGPSSSHFPNDEHFIISPTLNDSRMSVNGSTTSILMSHNQQNHKQQNQSQSQQPQSQQNSGQTNDSQFLNQSRPSSSFTQHQQQQQQQQQQSHLMNPILGAMNSGGGINMSNLHVFGNLNSSNHSHNQHNPYINLDDQNNHGASNYVHYQNYDNTNNNNNY